MPGTVIQIPFTFAPDSVGGTEVYVEALARGLIARDWDVQIAAPGDERNSGFVNGLEVTRLPIGGLPAHAEGVPDEITERAFERLLGRVRPSIVHLHAHTSAASYRLLEAARARGARTVFTYHTPTASCVRGTMLLDGNAPCDGRLNEFRCTRCVLMKYGIPPVVAALAAMTPATIGRAMHRGGLRRGPALAPRMRQIIQDSHARFAELIDASDNVVAVCDWVAEALISNGVPRSKLVISRQGLSQHAGEFEAAIVHTNAPLHIAYFGRLDPTKGLEVLIEAVSGSQMPLRLTIYGVSQPGGQQYFEHLQALAACDDRIEFAPATPSNEVVQAMRGADVIAVPSVGMETGPLVVLEAFAAGRPIIGSRRGGIAELVRHNIDGLLVEPGDVTEWRAALEKLANDRELLAALQSNIKRPRTMSDVIDDMSSLYCSLGARAAV